MLLVMELMYLGLWWIVDSHKQVDHQVSLNWIRVLIWLVVITIIIINRIQWVVKEERNNNLVNHLLILNKKIINKLLVLNRNKRNSYRFSNNQQIRMQLLCNKHLLLIIIICILNIVMLVVIIWCMIIFIVVIK